MPNKTWFITGASRGFGREWTKAALERGDRVAATARDTSTLDDLREEHGDALLALALDVTDQEAAFAAVAEAHKHFGRLDIVVTAPLAIAENDYASRLATWREWQPVAELAQGRTE
jgi:NADP-dependent 3-hydroxy acid dehydrogenase YdfG